MRRVGRTISENKNKFTSLTIWNLTYCHKSSCTNSPPKSKLISSDRICNSHYRHNKLSLSLDRCQRIRDSDKIHSEVAVECLRFRTNNNRS